MVSHGAHGHTSLSLQYSTKEDKYEEEIKLLGEKLKEVRLLVWVSVGTGHTLAAAK